MVRSLETESFLALNRGSEAVIRSAGKYQPRDESV
jgi:hypothetical protein